MKKNPVLAKIEAAYQEHLRISCLQMRQETADCAMQALQEAFGFGPERNHRFLEALNRSCDRYQDDLEQLPREEADANFEERTKRACGRFYAPREKRYDFD